MAYCTPERLRQALAPGLLAEFANQPAEKTFTAADLSNEQIQSEIDEASSMIDTALGGRYIVPVANDPVTTLTPHPIDYWVRNIAAYLATCTYRGSNDFADQDPVARRFALTMTALTDVRAGKTSLNLPDVVGQNGTSSAGASAPINPYIGNLFGPEDFSLYPNNTRLPGSDYLSHGRSWQDDPTW